MTSQPWRGKCNLPKATFETAGLVRNNPGKMSLFGIHAIAKFPDESDSRAVRSIPADVTAFVFLAKNEVSNEILAIWIVTLSS